MRTLFFIWIWLIGWLVKAEGEVRFATAFTDNMVLQQQSNVKIWGYARSSETVYVQPSWSKEKIRATADANGKWIVELKTPKAGYREQSITLTNSDAESVKLNNVLIGEVWLCSGQSNMEMVLQSMPEWNLTVENSAQEIAAANYPQIRIMTVGRKESFQPMDEIYTSGWKICTPENAKWFSAVAYFFGRKVHQKLHVPVGLVVSSYGGSPVQSWIPGGIIENQKLYQKEQTYRTAEIAASGQTEEAYVRAMNQWIQQSEQKGTKTDEKISLNLPVNLEKSKIGNQLGEVRFTRELNFTNKINNQDLHISLGRMDDLGRVYFNGELVWEEIRNSNSYRDIEFTIPASKIKEGINQLEVRVLNILWGGGLTGPAEKMYYSVGSESSKISLAGEWKYSKIFDLTDVSPIPREGKPLFLTASSLYNGMIYPLLGMTFKACLWYQGEGNVGDNRYASMFSDMINSWRKEFAQALPFYFVQIAPYCYDNAAGEQSVLIRELQSQVEKQMPMTHMAVTIDLGDTNNIHPSKKLEVGERLAAMALANSYNFKTEHKYPEIQKVDVNGKQLILTLKNTNNGLIQKDGKTDFEVSEDGKNYVSASTEIKGNQIKLNSSLLHPRVVRYCWHNATKGTIFNSAGLPLSSFKYEIK